MKEYFQSIINSDDSPIVICNLEHKIIYMNPTSIKQYGNLIGNSILNCHNEISNELIINVVEWFKKSFNNNKVHTFYNEKQNKDVYVVAIRNSSDELIGYYEKHEFRTKDNSKLYNF